MTIIRSRQAFLYQTLGAMALAVIVGLLLGNLASDSFNRRGSSGAEREKAKAHGKRLGSGGEAPSGGRELAEVSLEAG